MKKLTKQQMFNKAVLGVLRQGALSKTSFNGCKYRTNRDGKTLACGVGHLIADDLYTPKIEGAAAYEASPDRSYTKRESRADKLMLALCFSGVDVTDNATIDLLEGIQGAHDCAYDMEGFVADCEQLAADFGLTMPRLPKAFA